MSVFYFAYGSNADPDRFRDRVGPWRSCRAARLDGYRLRFAASVQSEGGGGAVVDEAHGDHVDGCLYEIGAEQMAAMDREEFDVRRNPSSAGRRVTAEVSTDDGTVTAQLYTVDDDGGWSPPSETYLGFIVRGLESVGHAEEAVERVRRIAARKA
jgi:cation transport regulator ChaC